MKICVTGGAGFIGSEFVRLILGTHPDDSVVVLDKLTYAGNLENLSSVRDDARFEFVHGDIADVALVDGIAGRVDAIVNFAAESHVDRSLEAPGAFIQTDVYGTFVLMEAARHHGHTRFLHVSTDEVYGQVRTGSSVEGDRFEPRSPYSASKAAAELLIQSYVVSYGFPALVTRGSNTYGPYQFPEKIIPLFITNALDGRELPVYGDGTAVRDYMYVTDHARGIDVVLRQGEPGQAYNLGFGGEVSGNEVANRIVELTGCSAGLIKRVADRAGHDMRYSLDSSRAKALGWAPQYDFAAGMEKTVAWYRENRAWWEPLKADDFWQFYERNYREAPGQAPAAAPADLAPVRP